MRSIHNTADRNPLHAVSNEVATLIVGLFRNARSPTLQWNKF
jgi:hypothetical protein